MLATAGGRWRLALGVLAFAVVAPVSLVGLPFAGLLLVTRPGTTGEWLVALLAAGVSGVLLLAPASGLVDAVVRAWTVLVTVAFAASAVVRPGGRFWSLALRACLYAAAGIAVLGRGVGGPDIWQAVQWDATRQASGLVRQVVQLAPRAYPLFEPAVRGLARGWPAWLVLETLAGLALAWQGHGVVARTPLGPPLAASAAPRGHAARRGARTTPPAGAILNH